MVKLPERLAKQIEENTIEGMPIGKSGWTVPWAMFLDGSGECFLNGGYTIHKEQGGTVQMYIHRTEDGYTVDISRCESHHWSKDAVYVGGNHPLPVARIIGVER